MENHNQTLFADPTLTYFIKYNTRLYIYLYLIRTHTHTTNLHASIYMAFVTPHKSKLWHDKLTTPVDFFPFVSVCNWSAL